MSPIVISFLVAGVMSVLFLSGKLSFGLVTMSCAIFLVLTGVLTIPEAFAGFTNSTVIMIASMFAVSAALQKTSIPYRMSKLLDKVQSKNKLKLIVVILLVYMVMSIVIPDMISIALVVVFLQALPKDSGISPKKMVIPLLMLAASWYMAVPVGMGATTDFLTNAFMQGVVPEGTPLLSYGSTFLMRIPSIICAFLYITFICTKLPDPEEELDASAVSSNGPAGSQLAKWQEYIVYGAMILIVAVLIGSSFIPVLSDLMWVIPAAAVCVFGFTNILSPKEITGNLANGTVFMLAGILAVTAALTKTGATEVLGNLLLPLISWTNNGFIIILICCTFAAFMTTFLSNNGTAGVMIPLCSTMAVAAGMDPRSLAAAACMGAFFAFIFPSGSVTCAYAFSLSKANPFKMLKYTLPLFVILVVFGSLGVYLVYPPFG